MKRNMVPLLGIAFVVAIISTGVFYGLFAGKLKSSSGELPGQAIVVAARDLDRGTVLQAADLRISEVKGGLKGSFSKVEDLAGATLLEAARQNEPLLEDRLASRHPGNGKTVGVPAGMRALSIRVSESAGIVGMLKPGSRVDVQAVSERNNIPELRTILQNIEVLAVNPTVEPGGGGRPPAVVVTVLARAQDVDLIALADSGARIRFALRNPLDEETGLRHSLVLGSVFQGSGATVAANTTPAPVAETSRIQPTAWDHPVQLHVQALGVSAAGLGELNAKLERPEREGALQVAAFRPEADAGGLIRALEQKRELEVVSAWRLTAGLGRPISFRAGAAPNQLRVQFSPQSDARGKVSLRVQPEISLRTGEGVETRKFEAGVQDGVSFLVQGWFENANQKPVLDGLFPGHAWSARELVILVTPENHKEVAVTAVTPETRGR